jgi:hypothetical protein
MAEPDKKSTDTTVKHAGKDIDAFLKHVAPLDVILFQGISPFSDLIRNGSELIKGNGDFSHCGLVVTKQICQDIKVEDESQLLLMEITVSIGEKVKDIETGRFTLGSQVRDLRAVLEETSAEGIGSAVCKLRNNPWVQYTESKNLAQLEQINKILCDVYQTYIRDNKSIYDPNLFSLLGTIFPSLRGIRDRVDDMFSFVRSHHPWLFCSELICIVYRNLGLLNQNVDVQSYVPVDFVTPGNDNALYSIMHLPPIFFVQIPSPDERSARRFFCCCV